jgi:hypothetical protein
VFPVITVMRHGGSSSNEGDSKGVNEGDNDGVGRQVKIEKSRALAAGTFQPKYYDLKTPGIIKMCFIDNQWRIFMKQQVIEDVDIPHRIRVKNLWQLFSSSRNSQPVSLSIDQPNHRRMP